ncbi:MAG: hypothetical protein ABIN61_04075 [candidate division WOR-3 bacterium]
MIPLILLFFFSEDQKIENEKIILDFIRNSEYEKALSLTQDKRLTGCIKILKGDIKGGIEEIKESATKGDIFSLNLFLLFNLEVDREELIEYIKREIGVSKDSLFSFHSPYIRYFVISPETLYLKKIPSDSIIYPYVIFKLGMNWMEEKPKKTKEYFKELIKNYPLLPPGILSRNTLRILEEKVNKQ